MKSALIIATHPKCYIDFFRKYTSLFIVPYVHAVLLSSEVLKQVQKILCNHEYLKAEREMVQKEATSYSRGTEESLPRPFDQFDKLLVITKGST